MEPHIGGKYDQFIGELWPGAEGWLPLSDTGKPIGPATLEPPAIGEWACPVFATFAPQPQGVPLLVTPSGADIDDHMLPRHEVRMGDESPESKQARKEVWAKKKAHWEKYYKPMYRTT